MNRAEAQGRSLIANKHRTYHLECISKDIEVPDLVKDGEGYYRVSYHFRGMGTGWVQQSKIRTKYPNLATKVVDVSDSECEWNAEIWVKRKEQPNDVQGPTV